MDNANTDGIIKGISLANATPMLTQMMTNITALGYTKVDISQSPE